MKRLLFFICTLLCANVLSAQYFWDGDLRYRVTGAGKVRVVDADESITSVNIPSSVTKTWKYYSDSCDCYITDSVRTYSVTYIGSSAFSWCTSLTSVNIPNSVTSIGSNAFSNCSSLTSVNIPNSVTEIEGGAFYNCSSLTSVTIPNSVTSIGGSAFGSCSSLTSVNIPNSVTSIGGSAFSGCSSLTSVNIPNSVTSIGGSAFEECSSLTSVNIPNSVTSIGGYAFSGCSSLTSVTIGNSVTSIGWYAFYDCSGLTSVTLPENITYIGNNAFYNAGVNPSVIIDSVTYKVSPATIPDSYYANLTDDSYRISGYRIITFHIGDSTYAPKARVYDCEQSRSGHVDIFSSIEFAGNTYPVTSIGGSAFSGCSSLTSVTIPNSVTSIGGSAFSGCSSLTSVTIPNSVTSIGDYAFKNCSSLTSVNIPNSVTEIGEEAFYNCSSLTSVTLPENVTYIGYGAFYNAGVSPNVVIDSVTYSVPTATIPNSYYANLTYYSYPISGYGLITFHIGDSTYAPPTEARVSSCDQSRSGHVDILSSIEIAGNTYPVTSIGYYAFAGCHSLTSVTIPNSVTYIGFLAFSGCSSLTSVTIGNSVTSIEDGAFYNAGVNASVIIDSVTYKVHPATIPNSCYAHHTDYGLITFHIGDSTYAPTEAMVYYCNESRSGHVDILSSIEIAGNTCTVTSIREFAFQDCSGLTSVNIPNSVTSIGRAAFSYCSSLTSVTLPENITYIGESAFVYAGIDASVIIDSVTYKFFTATIPDSYYANLTDYSYPISGYRFITFHIGDSTYAPTEARVYDCEQSRSGHVDILSSIEFAGNTCSVTSIGDDAFSGCSSLTSVNIPNSVTRIGWGAFYNCSGLTSVNIPNSVTVIEIEAFRYCSSLTSIDIPNSVTSIEEEAFALCSSLNSVTIGNSVTTIEDAAFYGCSSLNSVTIPNSVTSIGEGAFYNCSGLTTLNYNAINCNYNGFEYYDYFPFDNCPITTINIGNSVQIIPNYFAYELESLTSVTIGNSVTSIGSSAFADCSSLTSITCLADIPPALGNNVFNNTPSNKILYVNCGLINDYISSWGDYFNSNNIQEITFDINTYVNNESGGSVAIERNNCSTATLTATANICYQFVRWNDGNTENPRVVYLSSDTSFTAIFDSILFDTNINATINAGETYTEFGFDVNEEGTYTRILITEDGCDSIVTLTLNIIPVFNTELSATICQGQVYTENGFNVSEAGVYTQILTASNGFDSIVTLSLNVLPIFNTELSATICQGQVYNENGFNVSEAGVYSRTLQAVNGCDSVVNLTLSVNPIFNTNLSAFICEGETYSENGFNVSEAGTYTQFLQSVLGCDSVVTLTLNVNPVFNTPLTATICEGSVYNENGFNVSEAGTYTQSLQSVNGCDSIVTLTLNVNPVFNTSLTATICEGSAYTENGFNVSEAGVYTQTLQTVNGCDSIVTLTLNVNPIFNTELSATICEGQAYTENGFNVSEAGVYTQTLTSVNGCDSVVTLTVIVNPTFDTTINATINAGETYSELGFNESEAGTYVQNLQTVNGCDSTITLILDVNSSLMDVEHSEISFYPNPTDSKITFSSTIERIEVIDQTGRCVLTFSNAREINIESLPSGAYYLRLTNNDKAIMRKVIKE